MDIPMLADHPALDFVGTVAERDTTDLEHLTDPGALDEWFVVAGVLDRAAGSREDDLRAAKRVREAAYAALRAATDGCAVPRGALQVLNDAAAATPVTVQLTAGGRLRRTGSSSAALADIARGAIDLLAGDDIGRVRWCADESCTHPFLDRSRGGRRRWCGMAGCGDRAKARAYRARQRTAG